MKKIFIIFIFCFYLFPKQSFSAYDSVSYYSQKLFIPENEIRELISFSEKYNIPFEIVYHLLEVETGGVNFDHQATGPKTKYGRAYGIAQFMENTAPWVAQMANLPYNGKEDLFNASYSIKLAVVYLNYLQYGGKGHSGYKDWHSSLTAYNRGMRGLENFKKKNGTAVSVYSKKVLLDTEIGKY